MPDNNRLLKYIILFLSVLLVASSLCLYSQIKLQDETIIRSQPLQRNKNGP